MAENRKPILNGNPAVEPRYSGGALRSALAVPIEAGGTVIGVWAVHSLAYGAFSADDCLAMLANGAAIGSFGAAVSYGSRRRVAETPDRIPAPTIMVAPTTIQRVGTCIMLAPTIRPTNKIANPSM